MISPLRYVKASIVITGMLGLFQRQDALGTSVPFMQVPARTVNTNSPTLGDYSARPTVPNQAPPPQSPAPVIDFQGLDDNNALTPPDTHGAVGPNHVVTMLNTQVRIQNRSGTILQTSTLSAFWTSPNIGSFTLVFDPRILYDPYNHRWIACASVDDETSTSGILIGVSTTDDPTGTWNLRRTKADANSLLWADFPMLGFNKDWIVVGANMYTMPAAGGSFSRSHFYVYNKATLYAGNYTAPTLLADSSGYAGNEFPVVTYDNALATLYIAEDLNGNFGAKSYMRVMSITGAVGSETLNNAGSTPTFITTSATWDDYQPNSGADFAPQLGLSVKIQNNDSRVGNAVYRNGHVWLAHTVFLPAGSPTHSAVQWWQINPTLGVVQRGRIEDTSGSYYYAFPSIAVNRFNDVFVGFSRFSSGQYAGADYAFRDAFQDPGNLTHSERAFKSGQDSYWKTGGSLNRWGDYSMTVVDPVNDSDFWTVQEYSAVHSGTLTDGSGRWGAWWAKVTVTLPANDNFSAAQSISGGSGTASGTNVRATKESGEPNHAGNVGGTSVWYQWTAPANGSVTVDTIGSGFDTVLAAYTGTSVNALTSVASDHGSAGSGASRIVLTATSGTTYRIAVDGFNASSGALTLNWLQPTVPSFTVQPKSQNIIAGNSVTFTATAIGTPNPTYQWKFNGATITGATSSSYTKSNVQAADAGNYTVVASNSAGSATSATAVLGVYNSAVATLGSFSYGNSQFQFSITGVPGYSYSIQASTDLVNWTTLTSGTSPFTYTDTTVGSYSYRFFRAVH